MGPNMSSSSTSYENGILIEQWEEFDVGANDSGTTMLNLDIEFKLEFQAFNRFRIIQNKEL